MERVSQEDYDRLVDDGEADEDSIRFHYPPFCIFGGRTRDEFSKLVTNEGHATTSNTLAQMGIVLRAQHVGKKDLKVQAGDWICMRKRRCSDGTWRPCFNHKYRHAACK